MELLAPFSAAILVCLHDNRRSTLRQEFRIAISCQVVAGSERGLGTRWKITISFAQALSPNPCGCLTKSLLESVAVGLQHVFATCDRVGRRTSENLPHVFNDFG